MSKVKAVLSAFLFALSVPFSKILLADAGPVALASFLYLGGGAGLFVLNMELKSGKETPLEKKDIPYVAGFVLSGSVIAPVLLLAGLKIFSVSLSSLLINFELFFTSLIAIWFFRENSSPRTWAGIIIMFAAACVISFDFSFGRPGLNLGALLIIAATFFWGMDNNLTSKISIKNPVTISMIKCSAGGIFNFFLAMWLYGFQSEAATVFLAMFLGFLSYGLSIALLVSAMRDMGALRTQIFFGLNPFMAAIISIMIFSEPLNLKFLLAFAGALAAIFLVFTEKHSHEHAHEKTVHSHRHSHDDGHHNHFNKKKEEGAHAHEHKHEESRHEHVHYPDAHHKHSH